MSSYISKTKVIIKGKENDVPKKDAPKAKAKKKDAPKVGEGNLSKPEVVVKA